MPKTCYIVFEANPQKEYAYHSGALDPKPGDLVVVLVGADQRKKIVKCTSVVDGEIDPAVTKKIFGIIQEQPNAPSK